MSQAEIFSQSDIRSCFTITTFKYGFTSGSFSNDLLQAEDHMDNILGNDIVQCSFALKDGSDRWQLVFTFLISKYLWMRYRAFICCLCTHEDV